jgi:hypothetical protein
MYDIESIRAMYSGRAVELTQHFHARVKERCVKYADVKNAVMHGEIIEQLLDDFPNPSVLIIGQTIEGKKLHVAVGIDDDKLWLITAYFPTSDVWEADFKTRREFDDT